MFENKRFLTELVPSVPTIDLEIRIWQAHDRRMQSPGKVAPLIGPCLKSLPGRTHFLKFGANSSVDQFVNILNSSLEEQNETSAQIKDETFNKRFLDFLDQSERVLEALGAPFGYLVDHFVTQVVICRSDDFIAGSSRKAIGFVAINPGNWKLVDYVCNLIHEASHIEMFIREMCGRFTEGKVDLASPLRKQLRPQSAIFHAAFVLARVASALAQVLETSNVTIDRNSARQSLARIVQDLGIALDALTEAQLTPIGLELVEKIRSFYEAHAV